jgi:hypothetical protein
MFREEEEGEVAFGGERGNLKASERPVADAARRRRSHSHLILFFDLFLENNTLVLLLKKIIREISLSLSAPATVTTAPRAAS